MGERKWRVGELRLEHESCNEEVWARGLGIIEREHLRGTNVVGAQGLAQAIRNK